MAENAPKKDVYCNIDWRLESRLRSSIEVFENFRQVSYGGGAY